MNKITCGKCNGTGRYAHLGVCFACGGNGRGRIAKVESVTAEKALSALREIYRANRTVAAQQSGDFRSFADAVTIRDAARALFEVSAVDAEKVISAFAALPGEGPQFAACLRSYFRAAA